MATSHAEWDDFFIHNPASRHRRRIIHGLIARHALDFKSVLDVGCGDGRMLEEMQRVYGCEIHGIELGRSSAPERLGSKLSSFHGFNVEERALPRSFDLVMSTEVLEHLPRVEKAAANIAAMAGRHLLVTVPAGPLRKTDHYMGHIKHYTRESLTGLLEGAGFRTLECFYWGWPFHSAYRAALDVLTGPIMSGFGKPDYSWKQKAFCKALYALFFLNSSSSGCQLFYLGEKKR